MKESEVAKLIAMLKTHADHNASTGDLVAMWALAMEDVPVEAARIAYKHWILHHKWFPKPMEFRAIIEDKVCGLPSTDDAWSQLERSMRANYPGHPVTYTPDRIVIEAARQIGGTHALRNAQSGYEFDSLRERFRQVYAQMRSEAAETVDIAAAWQERQALPDSARAAIGAGVNGERDR